MAEEKTKTRVPVRQRGMETRDRIMQAAKDLILEKGYENTGMQDIAKRAGIAIGTIYTYYQDKQALLHPLISFVYDELFKSFNKVFSASFDDLIAKGNKRGLVHLFVQGLLEAHSFDQGIYKEVISIALQDRTVAEATYKAEMKYLDFIESLFKTYPHLLKIKDAAAAAETAYRTTDEFIHHILFLGTRNDRQRLIKELEDMLCAYLFHEFPADEGSPPA